MGENKFNYIVGVALVVLLVLIVYLGGRVRSLENDVFAVDARLTDVEVFLNVAAVGVEEDLLLEEELFPLEEELEGSVYGAFDDYYYDDYDYYDGYGYDDYYYGY